MKKVDEVLNKLAPILHSKWGPGAEKNEILGNWAEDDNVYIITVPYQLRDRIILMQNIFYDNYQRIEKFKGKVDSLKFAVNRFIDGGHD